jgi:hypothetical protein
MPNAGATTESYIPEKIASLILWITIEQGLLTHASN